MIKKLWRYSHLYLAISSSLFLLISALTGIILALEPIQKQVQYAHEQELSSIKLAEILPKLKEEYDEVFELKRSEDDLISVSALSLEDDIDGEYIIDLKSAKPTVEIPKQSDFYEFVTSLHRSLFLKNTGRFLVGINGLFLLLIATTGFVLIVKRQHGITNIFSKVIRLDFPSYSHTYLGRIMLIPLIILSLSAVILFLLRFEYIPTTESDTISYDVDTNLPNRSLNDFKVFQAYTLADIKTIEFPFSEFEDDYYILNLTDKTIYVHQYTGQIVETIPSKSFEGLYNLSYFLHTGKGSIIWSIILGLSSLSILYFMYSGLLMVLPRLKKKTTNLYQSNEAEYIILYGSETGSTQHFASLFYKALVDTNYKAYITSLNNYKVFPKMKNLVVFTSTHGKGEAPHNAYYFKEKFNKYKHQQDVNFAIVGFGSTHYENFCAFAKEVNQLLKSHKNYHELTPLILIDNRSTEALKSWWNTWNNTTRINTKIPTVLEEQHPVSSFTILSKETVDDGYGITFLLKVRPKKKFNYASGDLLGVYPPNENIERFYSIGKLTDNQFLLAVKLHEHGICSNYLYKLAIRNSFRGYVKPNPDFHLDLNAPSITFISNGTGIAPYLGMLQNYTGNMFFYWGGRKQSSWTLYDNFIDKEKFHSFELAFSREDVAHKYVQDLIKTRQAILFYRLQAGGIIMFCGSMQMQEDIIETLNIYATEHNLPNIEYWIKRNQIKIDTY